MVMALPRLAARITTTVAPNCLWKAGWNLGVKGMLSVERFRRRAARGSCAAAWRR